MIGLLRRPRRGVAPIVTKRLHLVPMTVALLDAEAHDDWRLGEALKAQLAPDWPPEHWDTAVRAHIVAQLTAKPETSGWYRYMLMIGMEKPLLVGCIGAFPCAAGDVELGYSVVNAHQRRGMATEAALGLIGWLFEQPSVHSVSAQAYETSPASVKVMQRCDMRFVGAGDEPGTVRYRRWR
jgi:[ribosomal protein S5]-alanine N-acetyltransferase